MIRTIVGRAAWRVMTFDTKAIVCPVIDLCGNMMGENGESICGILKERVEGSEVFVGKGDGFVGGGTRAIWNAYTHRRRFEFLLDERKLVWKKRYFAVNGD